MKIQKILNNNVAIARDENDKEVIVMSKGLGFRKKQGDIFPRDNTQKIFVLSNEVKGQYDPPGLPNRIFHWPVCHRPD